PHRFRIGLGGNREARFDDVHAQAAQLARQRELLVDLEREAGGLLAVAQGGVEDGQPVAGHGVPPVTFVSGRATTSPIYSYLDKISPTYAAARPCRIPGRGDGSQLFCGCATPPSDPAGDQPGRPADQG